VFFTLGGADANEHAVKFARQARGLSRGMVVARDRSYHGSSYAAMALSGDTRTRALSDPAAHRVVHVPPPYGYRCPFGSDSEEECGRLAASAVAARIDRAGAENVAAVIMEPDAGTNGIVAPDNYWPLLRPADPRAARAADRRRGDERLRPLRRVVRLAAPRRGRSPGPDHLAPRA
jgi:taurine--2-oxoglutarate transaminase